MLRGLACSLWGACLLMTLVPSAAQEPPKAVLRLRVGIIGCDTSHCGVFTKILNDPSAKGDLVGFHVVAAFPGGSPDVASSRARGEKFTAELKDKYGLEIVESIEALLNRVDVVLLESVDGRPHYQQARAVILAGKPLFIDKPVAGSLADALRIYQLAAEHKVPCFSSSSLRFSPDTASMKNNPAIGKVIGCDVHGPCTLEEHHPDLFWYGVHGVETLYAIMGPGCEKVGRLHTKGTDLVTGVWKDGRIGTFRGIRDGKADYGATVFGSKSNLASTIKTPYEPLVTEICKFFRTGQPPVAAAETIEMFTFMEAADESKRQNGAPVALDQVLKKAKAEVAAAK
jgi:predicted dehydrogenase